MAKLILASASPRRREILSQIGIEAEILPSCADEKTESTLPEQIVQDLARLKCLDTAERIAGRKESVRCAYVLGADTIVVLDGRIMGKPKDRNDAAAMIRSLQGRVHQVYTGVCILRLNEEKIPDLSPENFRLFSVCTDVRTATMTEDEIQKYTAGEEPMDKAGAYGIQGLFARHITGIDGEYTNVVGLPAAAVYRSLKDMGFFDEGGE